MLRMCAFRFRLAPRRRHREVFRTVAGCCRFVWNWALQQRQDTWRAVQGLPDERRLAALRQCSWKEQDAQLKYLKVQFPFLAMAPAHALQQVLRDLDRAWGNFFAGRAERPVFHARGRHDTFRESDPAQIAVNGEAIRVAKLGWIPYRNSHGAWWRSALIRQASVVADGDAWYVSVAVEQSVPDVVIPVGAPIGIDLGIAQDATTVDATGCIGTHTMPVERPDEQRRLAMLQRRVSHKRRGSRNRAKAQQRYNTYRRRITHRIRNAQHLLTTAWAKNHRLVVIEDLAVRNMSASARGTIADPGRNVRQKAGLNRAILQRGWCELRRQLSYKTAWYGSRLVVVPAQHTSQRCSRCGHTVAGNRPSQAVFACQACGHAENADVNAAHNILGAGLALFACGATNGGDETGTCLKGVA